MYLSEIAVHTVTVQTCLRALNRCPISVIVPTEKLLGMNMWVLYKVIWPKVEYISPHQPSLQVELGTLYLIIYI